MNESIIISEKAREQISAKAGLIGLGLKIKHLANNGGLLEGLDIPLAAEMVWTITSPEVFLLLTRDRNYSKERYTTWLETTLTRLLLP